MKFLDVKEITMDKIYEVLSQSELSLWLSQGEVYFKGETAIRVRVDIVEDSAGDTFVNFVSSIVLSSNNEERLAFVNRLTRDLFLSKFYLDSDQDLVFQVEIPVNPGIMDTQLRYVAEKFTKVTTQMLEQFEAYITGHVKTLTTIDRPLSETLH